MVIRKTLLNSKLLNKKLLCALCIALLTFGSAAAKSKKKAKNGFNASAVKAESEDAGENGDGTGSSEAAEDDSPDAAWQFLEWEEDMPQYVQKYEVVIEEKKTDDSEWTEINRLYTEDNSTRVHISPLLTPGLYRYKVITYDLIGIPEIESDWFEFYIYRAYVPQIRSVEAAVTHTSTIYLDEINDGIFNVTGRNLFELQEGPTDISFTDYGILNAKKNAPADITPKLLEFSDNNRSLKVQFDMNELDTGTYYFSATDASGLSSENSKDNLFIVKFRKAVDFDVAAGYTCPVIVIGDKMREYLNTMVLPLSVTGKISLMPFKRRYGYLGLGADVAYSRLLTKTQGYDLDGNYMTGHGLFIYQFPIRIRDKKADKLKHIATLELHGGAGLAMFQNTMFHFPHDIHSEPLNSLDFSLTAGLSGQIYLTNRLYLEAGADFTMPLLGKLLFGYVSPKACVGWQF